MLVLVTGSRNITNIDYVFNILNKNINKYKDTVVHGGAKGADSVVEAWCRQNNVKSIVVRPIYPSKKEYYLHRNAEMVGMCDKCLAFWDEKSRGTKFTFQYAKKRNKQVDVFTLRNIDASPEENIRQSLEDVKSGRVIRVR